MTDAVPSVPPGRIELGQRAVFRGVHTMHWEWPRFEVRYGFLRPRVLCQLEPAHDVAAYLLEILEQAEPDPLEMLGRAEPTNWLHHPPLRFRVEVEATPVEHGHFGHLGTVRWLLRVESWIHAPELIH